METFGIDEAYGTRAPSPKRTQTLPSAIACLVVGFVSYRIVALVVTRLREIEVARWILSCVATMPAQKTVAVFVN